MSDRARLITSKRLGENYWIVSDQEELIRQRRSGNTGIIFLEAEISLIAGITSDDDLRALFTAKKLFVNPMVVAVSEAAKPK